MSAPPRGGNPGSFRANIAWSLSSAGVSYLATFAAAPLLLALFSPESFGAFALLSTLAVLVGSVSAARYERAIVYEPHEDDAQALLGGCLALNLIVAALAPLAMILAAAKSPRLAEIDATLAALSISLTVMTGVTQTVTQWLTRHSEFRRLARAEMWGALAVLGAQFALGIVTGPSVASLMGGALAGRALTLLFLAPAAPRAPIAASLNGARLAGLAKRYRTLAVYGTPYAFVSMLQFRGLLFVAAYFGGAAAAGQLMLAYRVTIAPATAIGMSLRRVLFPVFASGLAETNTRRRAVAALAYLGLAIPPLVIVASLGLPRVGELLPAEWRGAVAYVLCLLPAAAAMIFTSWFDRVFDILNRQRSALALETLASVVAVAAALSLAAVGWTLPTAVAIYSALLAAYNLVWLGFTWRLINWPPSQLMRGLAAGAAYTGVLCAAFLLDRAAPWATTAYVLALSLAAWRRRFDLTQWLNGGIGYAHQELA